ncbi:MAG: EamA family transporter [Candidatus Aminicenantes bacterium]|nr:EamA family transporter [Candidatus Aminicenantes bacterium]
MTSLYMENPQNLLFLGKALALGSALVWAVAIILFRISGRSVHPLGLNLVKSLVSCALLVPTIWILHQPLFPSLPFQSYGLLLLSGVIGIALSDTLLFESLNRLGASLSAIVSCSYSPFVIIMASLFLLERMTLWQLVGVALIIAAVVLISHRNGVNTVPQKQLVAGIILGLLAMLAMAFSIVLMKPVLTHSSILWATLMRTVGGLALLFPVIQLHPRRRKIYQNILSTQNWKPMIPGSVLGGYVALVAWMGGMKYALVSVASVLNQTNSVFIFILGVIFLKEPATRKKVVALGLAFLGVVLVLLG